MDVKVTMRKTVSATDNPTNREKSVAIISSCWAAKKERNALGIIENRIYFQKMFIIRLVNYRQ
jgi:hypothetical protein